LDLHNAEALILDVVNLHDRDRIVTFLTREQGKKRGVAQGARRKFSRFAGQLQPLAKAKVTWLEKEGRDLVRISSVELQRAAKRLQTDLEGILLGSYLADHVAEFAQENEPSEKLFRLLDSTLEELEGGADRALAARYFEFWVLRLAGVLPPPSSCPLCARDLAEAGAILESTGETLVCRTCAGGRRGLELSAQALEALRRFGRENLQSLGVTPPAPEALAQIEQLCAGIRRSFLQRELKSFKVIQETLAG
jgi:DNA repair protein RecO (recombination protein O)